MPRGCSCTAATGEAPPGPPRGRDGTGRDAPVGCRRAAAPRCHQAGKAAQDECHVWPRGPGRSRGWLWLLAPRRVVAGRDLCSAEFWGLALAQEVSVPPGPSMPGAPGHLEQCGWALALLSSPWPPVLGNHRSLIAAPFLLLPSDARRLSVLGVDGWPCAVSPRCPLPLQAHADGIACICPAGQVG